MNRIMVHACLGKKREPLSQKHKGLREAGHQWLMDIILATWEAEIRRIVVPGQPRLKNL
jgi:hypothetical protein